MRRFYIYYCKIINLPLVIRINNVYTLCTDHSIPARKTLCGRIENFVVCNSRLQDTARY